MPSTSSTKTRVRRRLLQSGIAATGLSIGGVAFSGESGFELRERPLYLAIYRPGPGWAPGKPTGEQRLRDHGRYMLELYRRGALKFAGGFADHSGGAAVFGADDDESARAIVAADPAVVMGVMSCTVQRWTLVNWASLASATKAGAQR